MGELLKKCGESELNLSGLEEDSLTDPADLNSARIIKQVMSASLNGDTQEIECSTEELLEGLREYLENTHGLLQSKIYLLFSY